MDRMATPRRSVGSAAATGFAAMLVAVAFAVGAVIAARRFAHGVNERTLRQRMRDRVAQAYTKIDVARTGVRGSWNYHSDDALRFVVATGAFAFCLYVGFVFSTDTSAQPGGVPTPWFARLLAVPVAVVFGLTVAGHLAGVELRCRIMSRLWRIARRLGVACDRPWIMRHIRRFASDWRPPAFLLVLNAITAALVVDISRVFGTGVPSAMRIAIFFAYPVFNAMAILFIVVAIGSLVGALGRMVLAFFLGPGGVRGFFVLISPFSTIAPPLLKRALGIGALVGLALGTAAALKLPGWILGVAVVATYVALYVGSIWVCLTAFRAERTFGPATFLVVPIAAWTVELFGVGSGSASVAEWLVLVANVLVAVVFAYGAFVDVLLAGAERAQELLLFRDEEPTRDVSGRRNPPEALQTEYRSAPGSDDRLLEAVVELMGDRPISARALRRMLQTRRTSIGEVDESGLDELDRLLSSSPELAVTVDGHVHFPSIAAGTEWAIWVDESSARSGEVRVCDDHDHLTPWFGTGSVVLVDGSGERLGRLRTKAAADEENPNGLVIGPPGWLSSFRNRWVGIEVCSVGSVRLRGLADCPSTTDDHVQAVLEAFDACCSARPVRRSEEQRIPCSELVHHMLLWNPELFRDGVVPPISEILFAAGMEASRIEPILWHVPSIRERWVGRAEEWSLIRAMGLATSR